MLHLGKNVVCASVSRDLSTHFYCMSHTEEAAKAYISDSLPPSLALSDSESLSDTVCVNQTYLNSFFQILKIVVVVVFCVKFKWDLIINSVGATRAFIHFSGTKFI